VLGACSMPSALHAPNFCSSVSCWRQGSRASASRARGQGVDVSSCSTSALCAPASPSSSVMQPRQCRKNRRQLALQHRLELGGILQPG
jgi:hypothetical protein